jgi:hypothetical protein
LVNRNGALGRGASSKNDDGLNWENRRTTMCVISSLLSSDAAAGMRFLTPSTT